jgi:hypothetical protein
MTGWWDPIVESRQSHQERYTEISDLLTELMNEAQQNSVPASVSNSDFYTMKWLIEIQDKSDWITDKEIQKVRHESKFDQEGNRVGEKEGALRDAIIGLLVTKFKWE